ncbi:hypothetical protein J4E91_001772 [Alternaria rosae]|nr:hypothetical protein J4E91_001772 [Alternaria rosae]
MASIYENSHITIAATASQDSDGGHFWEVDWGDKTLNANKHWQKMVMEYTALRLTYESDRLPAIAALVERTSKLRKADDVYISGMWKNSILADLLWELNWKSRRPRPTQMVPSWSWASTQSLGIMWDSTIKFPERTKVVSLEYTAIGAANLGKVTDASITLSVTVLNLTAADELVPADINGLNNHERFEDIFMSTSFEQLFRQYGLSVKSSAFKNDYDLTTANPPNIYGRNIKLLVARYRDVYMSGIFIQRTSKNAEKYERIGFLSVCMETTKSGVLEQNDGDLEEGDEYRQEKIEETKEGIDSLIMALPMEEVKIV